MHDVSILMSAAATLKDHCEKIKNCSKCIFYNDYVKGCYLFESSPVEWELDTAAKRANDIINKELFENRTLFNTEV